MNGNIAPVEEKLIAEAKRDKIQRFVVGAVILRGSYVLFLQRPENDFMGGILELPSGVTQKGESLEHALYREIKEETNLTIKNIERFLDSFDYTSKSRKRTRQFNFLVSVVDTSNIALSEHDKYFWISPQEMNNYNITNNVRNTIEASLG